ncbi:unnamed protein product [Rhizoctonia solani]|uniref:BTB domain-containing protein n=1 Tax=Rhizoctonia solani TaxID=456999 RepID=A0A8H3C0U4_9AGAM|nr:unnamed protein product [Rhizoctonia solani]
MFKMPKPEGDGAEEGSSPEHPIIINGVSASDFTALLTVLYAGQFSSNQPTLNAPLIIPAFRLANMFNFSELRAYLLPLAEENLDDVDKIVFAREFDIKEWLAPAHIHLCQRDDHLSAEEARKLEVDSVLMISRMRERHRTRSSAAIANNVYCHKCCGWQYYGHSGYTCQHCNTNPVGHYLRYSGPGTMEVKTTTNDSALEIEVRNMAKKKLAALTSRGGSMMYTGKMPENKPDDNPAETSVTEALETVVRHPEFCFDNTLVAIQIENTLFNVHKYQLTKSEVFSDMFKMPKPKGDEPEEGSSLEHPIVIEGIVASDFAALLKVLYASLFSSNQPTPEAPLIIPAFRLANLFNFSELRAYLLPLAEKSLGDVDKIVFAREFGN